ncbi:MAG: hypothetical protein COY58_07860 [Gammaproteobacteria bacterium CG_4_10_14_0_8_um_filter_38_16]|nr:MAG: hypothetical protein COY58_07860 [Gammaproteobacteria bacterium CG_4_10_14_0_8_um_filter_38_16]PJA03466.1 MAG: hypothetical protein COX72_05110 [Gammaproteobacteria bacterium CG_4_10_14_0_2_um_filter_38_22]PJB10621.1 MAG: hypothetical protein CO120_04000 [Gammaproteobacteria bacterium CG_4_9_14_3_um_filter_38_9]
MISDLFKQSRPVFFSYPVDGSNYLIFYTDVATPFALKTYVSHNGIPLHIIIIKLQNDYSPLFIQNRNTGLEYSELSEEELNQLNLKCRRCFEHVETYSASKIAQLFHEPEKAPPKRKPLSQEEIKEIVAMEEEKPTPSKKSIIDFTPFNNEIKKLEKQVQAMMQSDEFIQYTKKLKSAKQIKKTKLCTVGRQFDLALAKCNSLLARAKNIDADLKILKPGKAKNKKTLTSMLEKLASLCAKIEEKRCQIQVAFDDLKTLKTQMTVAERVSTAEPLVATPEEADQLLVQSTEELPEQSEGEAAQFERVVAAHRHNPYAAAITGPRLFRHNPYAAGNDDWDNTQIPLARR